MIIRNSAEATISGEISAFADWNEDIYFRDYTGAAMDISSLDFYLQFRRDPTQTSADVTLSTDAGTLSIVEDSGSVYSILRIDAPDGTFASYIGDMVADLVAVDSAGDKTHYGHGRITVTSAPATI